MGENKIPLSVSRLMVRRWPNRKIRAQCFQHLAHAIAASSLKRRSIELAHADCQALLEFYVDSERRGEKAETLYPAVARHLQNCDACRLSHDSLAQALSESALDAGISEKAVENSPDSPPRLPFLISQSEARAWTKRIRLRVGGATFGFSLSIPASYLRQRLALRAPAPRPCKQHAFAKSSLLLCDTFSFGRDEIELEVWVRPTRNPKEIRLQVSLASAAPLPNPLQVVFRWNNHQIPGLVRRGRAVLERMAVADLEDASDLHIAFDAAD